MYGATGESAQHAAKQSLIQRPRLLQRGVARQRDFDLSPTIPHSRHGERQLLIGQIHRAPLPPPPHPLRRLIRPRIPRTRQPRHLRLQLLRHGRQTQRDQRLNRRQPRIERWRRRLNRLGQPQPISFPRNPSYRPHGWCPCRCEWWTSCRRPIHSSAVPTCYAEC